MIRPSFWLVMAIFGMIGGGGPSYILRFVVVAFTAVLFHELGHALTGRAFGATAWIELHSFGGLTHYDRALSRWRDVLMSAAGPMFGFLLAGICWVLLGQVPLDSGLASFLSLAVWINLVWSAFNLLPVLPLDGGRLMAGLLGPSRRRATLLFGVVVSVIVVAFAVATRWIYLAIMFGMMGFQNFQALGQERDIRPRKPPPPEKDALERGWKALLSGEEQEANRLAHLANIAAQTPEEHNAARDLLAWVALADQNPRAAVSHLEHVRPPEKARRLTWALALEGMELYDRALPHAEEAYRVEPSETSATLAIRLLNKAGRHGDAEKIASGHAWRTPALRDARLADVAVARGDHVRAAVLYGDAFQAGQRPYDAYNAACAHARAGDLPRAVEWLGRALGAGFDDLQQLAEDPDLEAVRQAPEIQTRLAVKKPA